MAVAARPGRASPVTGTVSAPNPPLHDDEHAARAAVAGGRAGPGSVASAMDAQTAVMEDTSGLSRDAAVDVAPGRAHQMSRTGARTSMSRRGRTAGA